MDLFNEIDDLSDLFNLERNLKFDSGVEQHEDLQSKYSSLHENYTKEIENSKKVEKCLVKCLRFYSKLCKKYEVQQKVISSLELSIKEKTNSLEEAKKNEERMKGLVQVYKTERTLYAGQTSSQLRKDKELLLDICCKLLGECFKNSTTRDLSQLLLRKFKKDLDEEKINMLKVKFNKVKNEYNFSEFEDLKPEVRNLKNETEFKLEDNYKSELTKVEIREIEDMKNGPLDLSLSKTEESVCIDNVCSNPDCDKEVFVETEPNAPGVVCDLPALEELPVTLEMNEEECQSDPSVDDPKVLEKYDLDSNENHEKLDTITINSESITESSSPLPPLSVGNELGGLVNEPSESWTKHFGEPGSIFDVSDPSSKTVSNCVANAQEQNVAAGSDGYSDISFETPSEERKLKTTDPQKNETKDEFINFEEIFSYEKEVFKIFKEMSSIRLLSPIRELPDLSISSETCTVPLKTEKSGETKLSLKRNLSADGNSNRSKKLRAEEEKTNCNLVDSIMSAMSIQNEEFKAKVVSTKEVEGSAETSRKSASPSKRTSLRSGSSKENCLSTSQSPRKKETNLQTIEKVVMEEIKNFISSPISSKEEADRNVKHCLSALSNKSEAVIAKCIVAIVFENVDEAVEIFERPSPPLTKTQNRLIVLLSVFRILYSSFQNISNKILSIISEKLFPDNFFWPDDCVEAATRFYAALCRAKNDPKSLWKFCLQGMTDMRQRCPLLMLTALKTWPDILHDAPTLKNNVLAVTIVNIFLHMPKKEGLRNFNQGRKLVALKHLLLNFYQFKLDDTIEGFTQKVLDSVFREEPGSEKSIVLLSKCRDQCWTVKNVFPTLKAKLIDWAEGKIKDSVASSILSVIKQISPGLQEDGVKAQRKDIGFCLSEILNSRKKNHELEVSIIEVLLQLKQFSEIRKVIREWVPKHPINDDLRNEIINASAENILRELKLNRKKEPKHLNYKKRSKKQTKKSKKKKLKGKKLKRNEGKSKSTSVCVSS